MHDPALEENQHDKRERLRSMKQLSPGETDLEKLYIFKRFEKIGTAGIKEDVMKQEPSQRLNNYQDKIQGKGLKINVRKDFRL